MKGFRVLALRARVLGAVAVICEYSADFTEEECATSKGSYFVTEFCKEQSLSHLPTPGIQVSTPCLESADTVKCTHRNGWK